MALKDLFSKKQRTTQPYLRADFLDSIPKNISTLEIGPFFNPLCRGEKVKYFDILDRNELISRAKRLKLEFQEENVPFIDYSSPVGDLSVIPETFDAVFSSHVIEHQPDLINHLQKVDKLLNDGGKYYLIIPDKRYCFDYFNPESSIADVLNAYYERQKKHTLKSVLEHRALITHNNAGDHWKGNHGILENVVEKIKNAIEEYNTSDYIDVHSLCFTPASFAQIIGWLSKLGYTNFSIDRIHETLENDIEFYCVLIKMAATE
jgi:SAM-dependent methyltransferase